MYYGYSLLPHNVMCGILAFCISFPLVFTDREDSPPAASEGEDEDVRDTSVQ